ncbi:hypothetical protein FRC07_007545 [Ceratobasidium sp. 392]|nr:hypothetical protein FRC07_007545 [Ceratobasidium sp. 392]
MSVDGPITSSVRMLHGRQFHNTKSNYVLPNDKEEHKRLSYQHEAIKLAAGANYLAPLPELNAGAGPQSILDVCSGSGQWAVEIAKEFPKAKVVGIDLSRPVLSESTPPANASFVIGDIKQGLPFETASFDAVHMRMVPSVRSEKELHFTRRCIGFYDQVRGAPITRSLELKPLTGGFILLVEPGERVSRLGIEIPPEQIAINNAVVATRHFEEIKFPAPDKATTGSSENAWGMATKITAHLRGSPDMWTNVQEKKLAIPIGVWADDEVGKKAGELLQYCVPGLYKAMRPAIVDQGILPGEEVDDLLSRLDVRYGPEAKQWQVEWPFCFVWAEKH